MTATLRVPDPRSHTRGAEAGIASFTAAVRAAQIALVGIQEEPLQYRRPDDYQISHALGANRRRAADDSGASR